jgi:hypothetical protein
LKVESRRINVNPGTRCSDVGTWKELGSKLTGC